MKATYTYLLLLGLLLFGFGCSKEEALQTSDPQVTIEEENDEAPLKAELTEPANKEEVQQFLEVILTWKGNDPDGEALTYNVLFGQDPTTLQVLAEGISDESYTIARLITGETYYWQITSKNSNDLVSTSNLSSFTVYEKIFEGDVALNNQEEVESYSELGYTAIAGNLNLSGQINISNLQSLNKIEGNLFIGDTPLVNLNGLRYLQHLGGRLRIRNNELLQDVLHLSGIQNFTKRISIENNARLANLNGLENAISLDDSIEIIQNESLQNLNALQNLTDVTGDIYLIENDGLMDLKGLENLTFLGGNFYIEQNPNLVDISGLNKLRSVGAYFEIQENPALLSISSFNALETVGYDINIRDNENLTSIEGFSNLFKINKIEIVDNENLERFLGFNSLNSLESSLELQGNLNLKEISGLDALREIGTLEIENSEFISSFDVFGNLEKVRMINLRQTSLKNLEVFDNVIEIENLRITFNKNLESAIWISPLNINELSIQDNESLTTLDFPTIVEVDENIYINNNPNLSVLQGFEKLARVGANFNINNNGIIDYCTLQNYAKNAVAIGKEINTSGNPYNPTTKMIAEEQCKL